MKALANKTIVSLRGKASENTSLTDEILYGMPVEILSQEEVSTENGKSIWCYVRTHYRYEGYCKLEDLYIEDQNRIENFHKDKARVIMQPYADILDEPRVQGVCMQSITRGGILNLIGNVKDHESWMEVELVDGRRGFTKEKYIGAYYAEPFTTNEEELRKRVTEIAKTYLGTQYRWGGKSTLGIDCSGLTSMSYMLCGVFTFRDADIVEGFPVHEITFENKKPGDLLYFPGHIAMYLGDDLYIHSTGKNGSDGVVLNSFDEKSPLFREDLPKILKCTGSIF